MSEKVFLVRGQRSRSYVHKCVNAIMAEAHISTVWRRGSLIIIIIIITTTMFMVLSS